MRGVNSSQQQSPGYHVGESYLTLECEYDRLHCNPLAISTQQGRNSSIDGTASLGKPAQFSHVIRRRRGSARVQKVGASQISIPQSPFKASFSPEIVLQSVHNPTEQLYASRLHEKMEGIPWTIAANIVGALVVVYFTRRFTAKKDPQEPPFILSAVPLVGHLIDLFRHGAAYFAILDKQHGYGLYTLPIFRGRFYIVNSPDWALAMHRAHKTLSFNTLVLQAMRIIFGMDERHMKIMQENADGEQGDRGGIVLET